MLFFRVATEEETKEGGTSGSTANRSSDTAAARHLNLRVLAGGAEVSRQIAERQAKNPAKNAQIAYSYAMPRYEGGEILEAPVAEQKWKCEG